MKKQLFAVILLLCLAVSMAASIDLEKLDIAKFTLTENSEKTLDYNGKEYTLILDSLTDSKAKFTFTPNNVKITVERENSAKVDIDKDGNPDFSISYLSIEENTATLEIKKSDVIETPAEVTNILNKIRGNLTFVIIGGIVALIILILIVRSYKKSETPERLYKKAEALHREAKEFHEDGDEETAQELYDKAEEYRDKAREKENINEVM